MNGRPSHASSRVKSLGLRCATIREGANRGLRNSERVNTVGVLILTCGERESRDLWTTLNITWHSVKGVALTSLPPSTETRSCLTTLTTLAFYRNGRTSLNWNTSSPLLARVQHHRFRIFISDIDFDRQDFRGKTMTGHDDCYENKIINLRGEIWKERKWFAIDVASERDCFDPEFILEERIVGRWLRIPAWGNRTDKNELCRWMLRRCRRCIKPPQLAHSPSLSIRWRVRRDRGPEIRTCSHVPLIAFGPIARVWL